MYIKRQRGWEIPEARATPETAYLNRRALIGGGALLAAGIVAGGAFMLGQRSGLGSAAASGAVEDPSRGLYPATGNGKYAADRPITPEEISVRYNNFYEFGTDKGVHAATGRLVIRPWELHFDGLVEREFTIGIDDLLRRVSLEERVYRHRAVEAWSMVVPWTGFPLAELVAMAKPLGSAKYLRMETFHDPDMASGQKANWYPWPYVEGLTMAEATNELAFVVTGAYGKAVAKSMGAPVRVHVPWKYGFKSIKSIARFSFVESQPVSFWQQINPAECGFWANVNPAVPHLRWRQETERDLATGERIPTVVFNGYGDTVAALYSGIPDAPLYT